MSIEENKKVSRTYHDLNPDDIEDILTPDFIGRHNRPGSTWNRDQHKRYWTRHRGLKDVLHEQIAEGDWGGDAIYPNGDLRGQASRAGDDAFQAL